MLGGEPLQSAFFRTVSNELIVVRWFYAALNQDVTAILSGGLSDARECSESVPFQVQQGDLLLFDSALQGSSVTAEAEGARTPIQLGHYKVTTEELKSTYSFLLHRFLRIDDKPLIP